MILFPLDIYPEVGFLGYMVVLFLIFFKDFIHLFMRDRVREREAETQAEGEKAPCKGARRWTRSRVSRIRPWAEGGAKPLSRYTWLSHIWQMF